ncbi:MAG: hypothetical protein WDO14_16430 [Bacteroidota bacterium]
MKNWKHYIFEFVILFVAVMAGFWADNWREKLSDAKREKEYLRFLISDLKSDKNKLNDLKGNLEYRNAYLDTLIAEFNLENLKNKSRELHFYAMNVSMIVSVSGLDPTDGAFTLLQNDGFRVIQKRSIIDSVFLYYEGVRRINNHYNELLESNHEMLSTMMDIFDFKVFNKQWNPLISMKFKRSEGNPRVIQQDPKQHSLFINQLADQKRRTLRTLHHVNRVSARMTRHIAFIELELASLN